MEEVNEKRKYKRIMIEDLNEIDISVASIYTNKTYIGLKELKKTFPLNGLDLSVGGMRFKSPLKIPINTRFKIKLGFKSPFNEVELVARIVRVEDGEVFVYGFSFVNVKYFELDIIREFINKKSEVD